MIPLVKQPGEALSFDVPMGLGEGRSIAAIGSVVVTPRGLVAEVTALDATATGFSGQVAQIKIADGTDGELYAIAVSATDDAGDVVEADVELQVLELAFTAPADGQAITYIEPSAYIARYGLEEAVRLTDTHNIGRIDTAALNAALADAAAEIDAYLAKRFSVPLDPVPATLERIAGDIARARLHSFGTLPPVVERNLTDARRQLRDLAEGRAALPGATPVATSVAAPQFAQGTNRPFSDPDVWDAFRHGHPHHKGHH